MNSTQHLLQISPRPTLRISEVERLIRIHRIVVPPLSRRRLYQMCESGEFECAPSEGNRKRYFIFEDAFLDWVKKLNGQK